jgi:hypothetical protein
MAKKKLRSYTIFESGGKITRRMTDEELAHPPIRRFHVRAKSIKQAYFLVAHPEVTRDSGEGIESVELLDVPGPTSANALGYKPIDEWPWKPDQR